MNPLTNVKNITKLNEIELASGLIHKKSWHDMYAGSAWIFIGGLEYGLTEGDILTVFSQYGEIVNINLVRDKKTGKSKGYCFLCYANQKSTILAVDNLNGYKLCNRTIRVDHVANYKPPKEDEKDDDITKMLKSEGCAPKLVKQENNVTSDINEVKKKKSKKEKKKKKKHRVDESDSEGLPKQKKRKHRVDQSGSEGQDSNLMEMKIKKEKHDPGYDKYDIKSQDIEKQKYQQVIYERSLNESSHSLEKYRLKSDKLHHQTRLDNDIQLKDKFIDKHKSKERYQNESYESTELYKGSDRQLASSSKKHRERSSSSSDNSSNSHKDSNIHEHERNASKRKYLNIKKKHQDDKQCSPTSSDDDSSSQSLSDDGRHKSQNRNSKKDKYKSYEKRSLQEESRKKCDARNINSDYTSTQSRQSYKAERYSEHRIKNKYRSDGRHDDHHRDSYMSKKDKR